MTDPITATTAAPSAALAKPKAEQREATAAGIEFEQMFLAEMLKYAGLARPPLRRWHRRRPVQRSGVRTGPNHAEAGGIGIAAWFGRI